MVHVNIENMNNDHSMAISEHEETENEAMLNSYSGDNTENEATSNCSYKCGSGGDDDDTCCSCSEASCLYEEPPHQVQVK
jgi:hypothetical protein